MSFIEKSRSRLFSSSVGTSTSGQPQGNSLKRPSNYLLLGIWFGVITGLMEGVGQMIRIFYLGRLIPLGPHVIWMAIAGNLIVFTGLGLVFYLIASRWPARISLRWVVAVFITIGLFAVFSLSNRLADYAKLLLAAGIAVQASHFIASHPQRFYTLIRYSLIWTKISNLRRKSRDEAKTEQPLSESELPSRRQFLVGTGIIVGGLAAGVKGTQSYLERQVLQALPLAKPDAPNVLLLVLDTVRSRSLSLYGYERPTTPFLERFAKNGVCFDHAIAPSPWTLPSHASMFTGQHPDQLISSWWQPLDATYPTLADVLSQHGYLTAGFVANTFFAGFQYGLNRGFTHYEDYPISTFEIIRSSELSSTIASKKIRQSLGYYGEGFKSATTINQNFLSWLSNTEPDRPFFAFLNYMDAHDPYVPPAEFASKFSSKIPRGHYNVYENLSDQVIEELNDAYDGAIAFLDHEIELLLAQLQSQNLLENTLVVIVSDHGEQFGEHGLMNHGNSLYMPTLHVPLLMSFPGRIPSNMHIDQYVGLRDLPATVVDLLGLETNVTFPGESLVRQWSTSQTKPKMVYSEVAHNPDYGDGSPVTIGRLKSLIFEGMHYIKNYGNGRERLYNLDDDPREENDFADTKQGRQSLEYLRASLDTITKNG